MSRWRIGAAVVVAAALAALVLERPLPEAVRPLREGSRGGSVAPGGAEEDLVAFPAAEPGATFRRGALRGTEVDGSLVVDASGNFVVTSDAVELFDYFFVASGEVPDDVIVDRIVAEIHRRLGPEQARDALALLDRYLAYRARAAVLAVDPGSLAGAFDEVVALRREIFGDDAELLFGRDEARVRIALAQRDIAHDPSLSEEERRVLIESLDEELPEEERLARHRATVPARLLREESDLRQAGATAGELRAHRAELFGEDAAERLAELDRNREAWGARVAQYRLERESILADPSLSADDRATATRALLEERFEGPERLRVEALDRIASEEGAS